MNGKYLLDTNIIIALFNNEENVIGRLKTTDSFAVSHFSLGELFYGAEKSERSEYNLKKIKDFAESVNVTETNIGTSSYYGIIKNHLKLKGKPIPENDIWIAAVALQNDMTLITRDKHFSEIELIDSEIW